VKRIFILLMVAVVVSSAPVLWATAARAGREVGNLTSGIPVLIAVPTISVCGPSVFTFAVSALLVPHLAYPIRGYISEYSDPVAPLWVASLARTAQA
jgi:hypothetical protein